MNEGLSELIAGLDEIAEEAKAAFGDLNSEQLNWKSNPDSWSIAQCFEHLIITNELEFPAIRDALGPGYRNPFWSKMPFLSNIFGKGMIYLFGPKTHLKVRAPKTFRPSQSQINKEIIGDFIKHQQKAAELFQNSKDLDIKKTNIVSPISSFLTYSLFDAYTVLIGHEKRHLLQAERVIKTQGFPS
jgi:hypothetical protein